MSDLERYRAFAQLCRDMAMSQSDARERDRLLRVSAAWERAAQRARAAGARQPDTHD